MNEAELEAWKSLIGGVERVGGSDREVRAILKDLRFMYDKIKNGHMIMRPEAMIQHRMGVEARLNRLGILV